MYDHLQTSTIAPDDRRPRLLRGFLVASFLALVFLAGTAYTSAATLFARIDKTQVMQAASDAAVSGRIASEAIWFVVAQISLHIGLAAVSWLLALATATYWQAARAKFATFTVGWFSLLGAAVIAYNAYWFPRTLMGAYYNDIVSVPLGPWPLAKVVYVGVVVMAVATLGLGAWTAARARILDRPRRTALATGTFLVAAAALVTAIWAGSGTVGLAAEAAKRPHVVIIGIDSLRLEQLRRFGGHGATPNLDRFLAQADLFADATTPAARTFSSWTAILTGRSPTLTGARFNLAARHSVSANPTIGDVLQRNGYRTVYSTDEVRFANIDESFGFDQVITPRIGASDFLIGTYNELPLASVVINTRLGQWLFPFSHANRGVATMFQPETYLGRVERELSFDQPTLFITHLTAPHWPYYVSDTPFGIQASDDPNEHPLYMIGLRTADRMFGDMLEILRRKGALDNALVIVLSDHGEAFGLPNDTIFKEHEAAFIEGLRAPLKMNDFGHGQSVLSPSQYQVLLGFSSFGHFDRFRSSGRDWDIPVTVEDIAPTILDLLGVPGDPLAATGQSLAGLLSGRAEAAARDSVERVRFTETDLAVLPGLRGGVDEVATARQNSIFFNVDPVTGRLELKDRLAPLAKSYKERAAFTQRFLLAAIPAGPHAHQYLYFDIASGRGRLLLERPGPEQPEAQRLWDELHDHYAGELKPAMVVTREDWPRHEDEWQAFYRATDVPSATVGDRHSTH